LEEGGKGSDRRFRDTWKAVSSTPEEGRREAAGRKEKREEGGF